MGVKPTVKLAPELKLMPPHKFEKPPLLCVLFSLHFKPLDRIEANALAFKENAALRGFPGFDFIGVDSFQVDKRADSDPQITFRKIPKWNFMTEDKKALIRLDSSSMTLHLADYSFFENAVDRLKTALELLKACCPEAKITRYTLRYINHIPLNPGESPAEWVNIALLGLPSQTEMGMEREGSVTETAFLVGDDQRYTVRCACFSRGLVIPPDLLPLPLDLKFDMESKTPFVRIENNHSKSVSAELDCALAFQALSDLRNPVTSFFSAITTPSAHIQWQLLP